MSDSESSTTVYRVANDDDDLDGAGSDTPIFDSDGEDDDVVILESDGEDVRTDSTDEDTSSAINASSRGSEAVDDSSTNDSSEDFHTRVIVPQTSLPSDNVETSSDPQESRSPPRKRKRDSVEPVVEETKSVKEEEEDDEEGRVCTICFEEWTNSGEHRIASLRCGHLFGHNCVTKWLVSGGKKCPQCNEPAKPKDVRVIFCRRLKAIDTAERDRALADLEKEKKKRLLAEATISQLRVQLEIEKTEKTRLHKELEKAKSRNAASTETPGDAASDETPPRYAPWRREAVPDGGCRLVAYYREMDSFLVTRQRNNPLFPGFGVQMMRADFSQQKYIPLHTKQIKCMSVNERSSYLLSVGLDKQIKLTSLISGNPIASFTSSRGLWACCWDNDDENRFYVGLDSGVVHVYDTRRRQDESNPTENYVAAIDNVVSKAPIVSINYVPADTKNSGPSRGLLVGHLDGKCVFYEESEDSSQSQASQSSMKRWRPHILPLEGSLMSMCFETTTRRFLATFRPNGKYPRVRHVLAGLMKVGNGVSCQTPKVFEGGHSQKVLTKSSLFVSPSSSGPRPFVVSGDEASSSVFVWDGVSGQKLQSISFDGGVVDVCHVTSSRPNDVSKMALLADKVLAVYRRVPSPR